MGSFTVVAPILTPGIEASSVTAVRQSNSPIAPECTHCLLGGKGGFDARTPRVAVGRLPNDLALAKMRQVTLPTRTFKNNRAGWDFVD